ncbi:telomere length regulation protein-domain-containing protein [Scleroderma yunnanense]
MSWNPDGDKTLQDVIDRLQTPITDIHILLPLLCFPLGVARILPPQYRKFNTLSGNTGTADNISRAFSVLQRVLLETIWPTWEAVLEEEGCTPLLQQYFSPDAFANASIPAGSVALCAYSTILALPINQRSIVLLLRLTREYPVDRLFRAVSTISDVARRSVTWDDCLRNLFAVPAKVANALASRDIPSQLCAPDYLNNLSIRCESLICGLSPSFGPDDVSLATQLFAKLVNVGVFPSSTYLSPSQPSFFRSVLPLIRRRLREADGGAEHYMRLWNCIVSSLSSVFTQQAIVGSLFASLTTLESPLGTSALDRGIITKEAYLLRAVLGDVSPDVDSWQAITTVILTRTWGQNHARLFVCWMALSQHTQALETFLSSVIDIWSSLDHIKYSLLSQHQYMSALLLLLITHFPLSSPRVTAVVLSPAFISAIGQYISYGDQSIRRCGMVVAEIVASRAGKSLDFGDWDGDAHGRDWAKQMRTLCSKRDVDFEARYDDDEMEVRQASPPNDAVPESVTGIGKQESRTAEIAPPRARNAVIQVESGYDSDDSLTGYASPPSTRSPSPTPSEMEELERNPTLRIGIKKISRPVYLTQLGDLVRSAGGLKSSEENQEADKIEMALRVGEDLIRRKRDYGTELAENAVNLVYGFITLNNNYDLKDFDDQRQRIMIALIVSCPKITASCVIEEFFKNQYSTEQRFVMLNALSIGARELACLPTDPESSQFVVKPLFPSKMLPPAWHQRYFRGGSQGTFQLLLDNITRDAIDKGKEPAASKAPEYIRERQLRIRKPARVSDVAQQHTQASVISSSAVTYNEVAAEYFIMPFVHRFWTFLRDERTREERTANRDVLYRYRGAGTGLILNPIVLSHFLGAMAVLVHAAVNAPQWLAIIAPDTLELAVALGSRQITMTPDDRANEANANAGQTEKGNEASVLTSALELALVILDGSLELDGGRTLSLEHTTLLLSVGEWAGEVFALLNKGTRVEGGGGSQEIKLRRAAGGVVLKFDELTSRWRRSMVDVR